MALNVPGPVAAARLRDLGAVVTKVEPPEGDALALVAPDWYAELSAGMEVVRLDLKTSRLTPYLEETELLLTSQRPSALARLGLTWDEVHSRHPRLSQVAIVGHAAPDEERAGHDLTYLATHGLVAAPQLPRTLAADLCGALLAVEAALVTLLSGEPQYVEVALASAAEVLALPLRHGLTRRGGILGGGFAGYGLYEALDGWIAIAALEPRFRQRLAAEFGLDDLTHEELAVKFRTRTTAEWEAWAAKHDLPLAALEDFPP